MESLEILLMTNQRNMKAMLEVTSGPNDENQIIEVEATEASHPFYCVLPLPGINTLRILNQNSVEFPFDAYLNPKYSDEAAVVVDTGGFGR